MLARVTARAAFVDAAQDGAHNRRRFGNGIADRGQGFKFGRRSRVGKNMRRQAAHDIPAHFVEKPAIAGQVFRLVAAHPCHDGLDVGGRQR